MVNAKELTNNMTDWISLAETARIWGKNGAQVTRRMQQGKLTIRVSYGRRYLFRKEVEGYTEPKMGNPDFIHHINGDYLDKDAWKTMQKVISKMSTANTDVVYQPKMNGSNAKVDVHVLDDGKWAKFAEKKLA